MGDITGTLAVSYAAWDNPDLQKVATLNDIVELEYLITSSHNDLASDAEGFGYYDLWKNVFRGRQEVTLSELLTRYYSPNFTTHTYRQRWKSFCEMQKFIIPAVELNKYK
ncbi:hypothetical protein [uncultured Hymenobacter sp.]|uniref:hypothetical protein n=1 Tax=uncultured Hymenobacter sp. TaxID=170016 RepID=UPI0035CA26A1